MSSLFSQNPVTPWPPCDTRGDIIYGDTEGDTLMASDKLADLPSRLSTEVFQQFYSKLVETLPMDDPYFTVKLFAAHLLPPYLKEYVSESPATRTEKATRFLDKVIKPSMTSFTKLLNVMEVIIHT